MRSAEDIAEALIELLNIERHPAIIESIALFVRSYGDERASQAEEQLKHTKEKINEQARYIAQLEQARDFWRQKYNDAKKAHTDP